MADRMDTARDSPMHGLSIWVGLASFFSSSSERNKAQEAIRSAHEAQKAQKPLKTPGANKAAKTPDSETGLMMGSGGWRRVGEVLGIGRKHSEVPKGK
jgi:hypothetical protein